MDIEDEAVRGEVRVIGYRRVSHGLYLRSREDLNAFEETLRDLAAWRAVLPEGGVFTHLTGAWLAGWWLPALPDHVPVYAAADVGASRPRRPGLICSRLTREVDPWILHGLPVDRPEEILLRCARDLSLIDLVPMVDSALRAGHVTFGTLVEIAESGRPGVRRLRDAIALADPRSESRWESILRLFHSAVGIEVESQVDIFDDRGTFVARADLLVVGTTHVHEYDGGEHRKVKRHQLDLRRERRFAGTPYVRSGYSADDLINHPLVVLAEMDRMLGRRHRPERIRLWRSWVQNSTLSQRGLRRLFSRWIHLAGTNDWSQTA